MPILGLPPLGFEPVRKYHLTTFGCQMNEHDSERMKGMLESLGYSEAAERSEADLILFNTCSIREKADERFVAHLREANALKRRALWRGPGSSPTSPKTTGEPPKARF